MATTTLTGTTGNDILNAPGSVTTLVAGFQGNDTLTLSLASDEANAGAGDDSIVLGIAGAAVSTVSAGSGNDTVTVGTAVTTFNGSIGLGGGNDFFSNTSVSFIGGTLGGNAGQDTISVAGGATNLTIGGGADADSIAVTAGNLTLAGLVGGGGADTINLSGAGAYSTITVQAADGHDKINVTGLGTWNTSIISGGKGFDSIQLSSAVIATVKGGAGDDTVSFVGNSVANGVVVFGDSSASQTAGGADLIGTSALVIRGNASIYGGGANDTINFASPAAAAEFVIDGGEGDDLIGNTAVALVNATATSIIGGAGADTIKLQTVATGNVILGGAGADSIFIQTGISTINGGDGADTITFGGTSVSTGQGGTYTGITINGGAGADRIIFSLTGYSGLSANGAATGACAGLGAVVYEAGDTLVIGTTSLSVSAAAWAGAGGQIAVRTGTSAMEYAANAAAGTLSVFDVGDDLLIGIKLDTTAGGNSGYSYITVVGGGSLIKTAGTGLVNNSTANFGFSVAAASGTAGEANATGIAITFA